MPESEQGATAPRSCACSMPTQTSSLAWHAFRLTISWSDSSRPPTRTSWRPAPACRLQARKRPGSRILNNHLANALPQVREGKVRGGARISLSMTVPLPEGPWPANLKPVLECGKCRQLISLVPCRSPMTWGKRCGASLANRVHGIDRDPSCASRPAQLNREWSLVASLSPSQRELSQYLKYIARDRISEFESSQASHGVGCPARRHG
jgi:hypothetical protein